MVSLGELVVSFAADLSKLTPGIHRAKAEIRSVADIAQSSGKSIGAGFAGAGGGLLDFGSKLGMTVFGIKELAGAALGMGQAFLAPAASMEQTKIAFTTLLGGAQQADQFLRELSAFAATTPFEFPELAGASQKLLAFGFAGKDIIPMMTSIGDSIAALGGGQAEIDRLTMAFGQMNARGKVTNEELLQMAELGIPVYDILGKAFNKTTGEIQDMASDGLIPAQEGIDALLKGMEEKFPKAMQAQSQTFNGLMSTLKDLGTQFLVSVGTPILEVLKTAITPLIAAFSDPAFTEFANNTGKMLGQALTQIGQAISSYVLPFWGDLQRAFQNPAFQEVTQSVAGSLLPALQQLGSTVVGEITPALHALIANFTSPAFVQFSGTIATSLVGALTKVAGLFGYLQPIINAFFQVLTGGGSSAIVTGIFDSLGTAIEIVTDLVSSTLMPAFLTFMDFLSSSDFTAFSKNLMDSIGVAMEVVGQIIAAIIPYFQTCFTIFMQMLPPLMKIGNAILAILNPALRLLGFLFSALMPVLSFIANIVGTVLVATINILAETLMFIANVITGTIAIFTSWGQTTTTVQGWWQGFVDWFMGIMGGFGAWLAGLWQGIQAGLAAAWNAIVSVVQAAGQNLLNVITTPFRAIGALFQWLYDHNIYFHRLVTAIRAVVSAGVAWLQNIWNQAVNTVVGFWNGLVIRARAIWNVLTSAIQVAINAAVTILKTVWTVATSWVQTQWNKFATLASTAWQAVSRVFSGIWSTYISGPLSSLWNSIVNWFNNMASEFGRAGGRFIDMLVSGIRSGVGSIWNAVTSIADTIWKALGFHSPPEGGPLADSDKYMPRFVDMLSSGLVAGASDIRRSANLIADAMSVPLLSKEPLKADISSPIAALVAGGVGNGGGSGGQEMIIIVDLDGNTIGRFNTRYQDGRVRAKFGMRAR